MLFVVGGVVLTGLKGKRAFLNFIPKDHSCSHSLLRVKYSRKPGHWAACAGEGLACLDLLELFADLPEEIRAPKPQALLPAQKGRYVRLCLAVIDLLKTLIEQLL